ncbi:MAG: hypothetical protein ACKVZH_29555 [Blastocatellia bacterium]
MTQQTMETTNFLTNEDANELASFLFDDLALTETEAQDVKGGRDFTVAPPPPQPCIGCNWGPPLTNHNETTVRDEEEDPAPLHDLPVAQAELDLVQGGGASPQPVLLVLSNSDFYYR